MPANLSPEYRNAEKRLRDAKTPEEKIPLYEEMLAVIPKHKGTDKLQADLKKRLSKLRNLEESKSGKRSDPFKLAREGAGRVILVGTPNVGKSALMNALTNASPEVAPYPFTTLKPMPGMMRFEDIQIQLIDTAPVTPDRVETWHSNLTRSSDLALCVVDLNAPDPAGQYDQTKSIFEKIKVNFIAGKPEKQSAFGTADVRAFIIATKYDLDEDDILLGDLRDSLDTDVEIIAASAVTGARLPELRKKVFDALEIVRIYSKIPGRPPEMKSPFTLPVGSTVQDVARTVHKDFSDKLRYARIWGSERFDGQQVQRDYVVSDRDVIELHL